MSGELCSNVFRENSVSAPAVLRRHLDLRSDPGRPRSVRCLSATQPVAADVVNLGMSTLPLQPGEHARAESTDHHLLAQPVDVQVAAQVGRDDVRALIRRRSTTCAFPSAGKMLIGTADATNGRPARFAISAESSRSRPQSTCGAMSGIIEQIALRSEKLRSSSSSRRRRCRHLRALHPALGLVNEGLPRDGSPRRRARPLASRSASTCSVERSPPLPVGLRR